MKTIVLCSKKVKPRKNDKEIVLESTSFFKYALENYPENLKGIEKILTVGRIIEKINLAEGSQSLELEDAEFDILKLSSDKVSFNPIMLHAPEILEAIKKAEKEG